MKSYLIKKGIHHSSHRFPWFSWKKEFRWKVLFTESCKYVPDPENDTNKLVGFSFLWSIHKHSARFGWRYNPEKNKIEILSYCYVNKERKIQYLVDIDFNTEAILCLKHTANGYWFDTNITLDWHIVESVHNQRFKFGLFPFFGGNAPAPHDIIIKMERI